MILRNCKCDNDSANNTVEKDLYLWDTEKYINRKLAVRQMIQKQKTISLSREPTVTAENIKTAVSKKSVDWNNRSVDYEALPRN